MTRTERAAATALAQAIRLEVTLLTVLRLTRTGTGRGTTTRTRRNVPTADTVPAADEVTKIIAIPLNPSDWCGKTIRMPMETRFENLVCCRLAGHDGDHYDDAFLRCWS